MEEMDLRVVLRKLARKWYWFVLSLAIALSLAALYLFAAEEEYEIEASIQLKDQSLGSSGAAQEKFISGFELLDSDAELEDEIGILTSYSSIRQSLEPLDFELQYYEYNENLGFLGRNFAQQVYPAPFFVELDTSEWQLLYTPIDISFLDAEHYRVRLEANELPLSIYHRGAEKTEVWPTEVALDTILTITDTLKLPYLSLSLTNGYQEEDKGYYVYLQTLSDITDYYQGQLKVETISESSNIAKLRMTSSVPKKDKVFLQTLTSVYIQNDLQKKNQLGRKTIEFIDLQLANVADSLQQTEGSLQNFRAKSSVINVETTSQNLSEQLFSLEERQAELSVQNEYYRYMADYLASNNNITDVVAPSSVGIQDELLNNLLIQLATLNEEKVTKDYSSNPNNPVLRVLERKIQNTKQALIDNIDNLISSNNIGMRENNRRIAGIQKSLNQLPQNERNLTDIERRFAFNDNIYNYLLQQRAEAGIAIASNVPDKTVIDSPRQISKKPVSPNKLFVLLFAMLVGLVTPAGLIFANDFFKVKLETDEQLASWTNVPVIERIAQVKEKEKRRAYIGESYLAHAFRYVRHHVEFLRDSQGAKVIGVTSAKSGEGKTFVAKHLAESFAQTGLKILLIDADLHHPTLAHLMNARNKPGLSDILLQSEGITIQKTATENLDIIGSGTEQFNPSDLLAGNLFASLMDHLKQEYELIILDTPPLGTIADYLLLSKGIDYTLWVVRHEYSQKEDIQRLDKLIHRNHITAGIVYNGAKSADVYTKYYRKTFNSRKV